MGVGRQVLLRTLCLEHRRWKERKGAELLRVCWESLSHSIIGNSAGHRGACTPTVPALERQRRLEDLKFRVNVKYIIRF